jgi:hypothetical protein
MGRKEPGRTPPTWRLAHVTTTTYSYLVTTVGSPMWRATIAANATFPAP